MIIEQHIKGFAHYIFAGLFSKSKERESSCQTRIFLFHFKSSFSFRENKTLNFAFSNFMDVIK